jgi:hypothetical protein
MDIEVFGRTDILSHSNGNNYIHKIHKIHKTFIDFCSLICSAPECVTSKTDHFLKLEFVRMVLYSRFRLSRIVQIFRLIILLILLGTISELLMCTLS